MTQEDKELLLKDLCERLPYGVKFKIDEMYLTGYMIKGGYDKTQELYGITREGNVELLNMDYHMPVESIKPYLFPLSSMTPDQRFEYNKTLLIFSVSQCTDWCNKNHFDYRGLIEKGLAIDATNLNIY
jgi:hypothetical protein